MKTFQKLNDLLFLKDWNAFLRFGIAAFTLLLAIFIGLKPYSRLTFLIILAISGLVALLVFTKYLEWGLILLIPISYLVDIKIRSGTAINLTATFLWTALLLVIWLLRMLVIEKKFNLVPNPVNLPSILFIIAMVISLITSFLPWVPLAVDKPSLPAQFGALFIYLFSIGILLLTGNLFKNINLLRIFTWVYIFFGLVFMLSMVIPWDFTYTKMFFVDYTIGQSVFWTMLTALMFGQALFNQNLKPIFRYGLILATVVLLIFVLFKTTQWVSGWLPPLITIFLLVWLRDWRIGVIITVLVILTLLPVSINFYNNRVNTAAQSWSTYTRFSTWPIMFNLIKTNPLTGLGPGNYRFYTSVFLYLGYHVQFNSHNNYFDIMLQYGLVGFGLFLWLIGSIFLQGWRLRFLIKDGFEKAYVNAILAGMFAVLFSGGLGDWFLPFLYNIELKGFHASILFWVLLGGMLSLYSIRHLGTSNSQKEV